MLRVCQYITAIFREERQETQQAGDAFVPSGHEGGASPGTLAYNAAVRRLVDKTLNPNAPRGVSLSP